MALFLISIMLVVICWALVVLRYRDRIVGPVRLLPVAGFATVVAGSVFSLDFFHVSGGPIPITLDRLLLGGICVLFAVQVLARRETVRRLNGLDLAVLALTAILTYSTVGHDYTYLDNLPLSRLLFFNLLPLALYFVMRHANMDFPDLRLISIGMVVMGGYLALTAIAETRGFGSLVFPRYIMDPAFSEFFGRGRGPFLNPVSNGVFQVIGLACLAMWWHRQPSARMRLLIMSLALLMAIGVYSTFTRSVWLGLIVTAGIAFFLPADRRSKGAMIMAATIGFIALFPVVGEKLISFKRDKNVTVNEMEKSAQLRPLFFTVAMRMVADQPIAGVGFGQYAIAKYPYLQDPKSMQPLAMTKTYMQHNIFLSYVTETGFVGLTALVVMLGVMTRLGWRIWRDPRQAFLHQQFGLLLVVMVANHCVNGMFHDVSIIPMENMLLLFIAAIVNNVATQRSPQARRVHRPTLVPLTLVRRAA